MNRRRIVKIAVLVLALAGVAAYWSTGRMDPALANLGLNATDCGQNGFGATLCGDALKRAQREQRKAQAESDAIDRRYDESMQKLADQGNPYAQEEVSPSAQDAAQRAFMPCDNEDTWETVLRVRPR